MEALLATEEGNIVLGDDMGTSLIDGLAGEWRLLYTSSNAMEYNQVKGGSPRVSPDSALETKTSCCEARAQRKLRSGAESWAPHNCRFFRKRCNALRVPRQTLTAVASRQ